MIAKSIVITKLQNTLTMISPEMFPEIFAYISSLPGIDTAQKPDDLPMPLEIANTILTKDRPRILPEHDHQGFCTYENQIFNKYAIFS